MNIFCIPCVSEFMSYLKGKSTLMLFDRHPEYRSNKLLWCCETPPLAEPVQSPGGGKITPPFEMGVDNFELKKSVNMLTMGVCQTPMNSEKKEK